MGLNTHLKKDLEVMDEKYGDQMYKIFGPTLLGFPEDCDSSRLYMLTSHLKQVLTLLNPDVARIQTGFEKEIGKWNHAFKQMAGTWEVKAILPKFKNNPKAIYTIVLYNEKTDTFEMIEKEVAEPQTEKHGYMYNTEVMDGLEVGDMIRDAYLYKSTSYDKHMNYRFGKNAKVYFSISNDTLEDAILIRRSWCETVKSVQVEIVEVPVNDNDILLNVQGDDKDYRAVPDIGEQVRNSTLCATRRINKSRILYDFQSQNMRNIASTDVDYVVSKNSTIFDMDIYYNNEHEFPDNAFFHQVKEYHDSICVYADQVTEWATNIKESGSKYTKNVPFLKSKYAKFNNPEYKWTYKEKAFSNMVLRFKTTSIVSLENGSKLTGRYGNKGVISRIVEDYGTQLLNSLGKEDTEEERAKLESQIQIVEDDRMPYSDDFPIDICLNMSGSIRRLNPGQLVEVEINFIGYWVQKMVKATDDLAEKERLIFTFIRMVNEAQYNFHWKVYNCLDQNVTINQHNIRFMSESTKRDFIASVEKDGFYLIKPVDACIRYEAVCRLYDAFPFAKPIPLYIDIFGTKKRRIIKDGVAGDMYILPLKQNTNKNFSARSTFRLNRANLPAKDISKKTNRSSYAKTPVRFSEIYNPMISVSGRLLAEYNLYMRSSAMGSKTLGKILTAPGNPLEIKRLPIKASFINQNAQILAMKLKSLGIRIEFMKTAEDRDDCPDDSIIPIQMGPYTIYDTYLSKPIYARLFYEMNSLLRKKTIVESYPGERYDISWDMVFAMDHIKRMEISDEIQEAVRSATKNHQIVQKNVEIEEEEEDTPVVEDDETETPVPKAPPKVRRGRKKVS